MKRLFRFIANYASSLYLRGLYGRPIFPIFRKAFPILFYRARDWRSRLLTRWHWWKSRHFSDDPFLPALKGISFSTRSILPDFQSDNEDGPKYIPINKASYFKPPAPKTLGDSELAARLRNEDLPLFAARLRNASVFGDAGDVITEDGMFLADISYSTPSDVWLWRHNHPSIGSYPLPEPKQLDGSHVLLTSSAAGANYFHWMFNLLPRVRLLECAGIELENIDGFLVNRMKFADVQKTMLQAVGINLTQTIEMDDTDSFQPRLLWVTSNLYKSGHRSRWSCDWLRERLLLSPTLKKPTRRLYLSREGATHRSVANEEELLGFLIPLGFEKVVIGNRSVFEQSALFASADIVIGPHGAGFTNIVFCAPRTRIIELIPKNYYKTYYWELSACMDLDYYYAFSDWDAQTNPSGSIEGELRINLDRLARILHLAGIK